MHVRTARPNVSSAMPKNSIDKDSGRGLSKRARLSVSTSNASWKPDEELRMH